MAADPRRGETMSTQNTVQRITIVGTGTIGASWATYYLARGFEVTATDPGKAQALRSYWDERRYLAVVDPLQGGALGSATAEQPLSKRPLTLEVSWPVAGLALRLPIGPRGLKTEGATIPEGLQVAPW